MNIDGRDRVVVQLVARFSQLASSHVADLEFSGLASHTSCDRTLRRLTARGYLARIERRTVGGSRGGSGQYVYQLGRLGWAMYRTGRYAPWRAINYHALGIADAYIALVKLERAGSLKIVGFSTEPDCWVTIGRRELKPDFYVELARPGVEGIIKLWLEYDTGSEGQRQIKEKFERYWNAYNEADDSEYPVFPLVVFVAVDDYRTQELRWLLEQGTKDARQLFRILSAADFAASFS